MRKVDRSTVPVPASLAPYREGRSRQSKGANELARNRAAFAAKKPKMVFAAYKEDNVKAALHALFHGKCAYCESFYGSTAPVDVEHFRPKGKVAEDNAHPGYWWLAADWGNLLPSCIDCNRRRRQQVKGRDGVALAQYGGKQDRFPVETAHVTDPSVDVSVEKPLLIDPCRDDPARHLGFLVDNMPPLALALPLDAPSAPQRGEKSISIFGLNRLALVQDRTRILRRLEMLRSVLAQLEQAAQDLKTLPDPLAQKALAMIELAIDRLLEDICAMAADTEPYSTMVAAWMDRWADDLEFK
jgi:uncharacterized protein (TIGR02646 family)